MTARDAINIFRAKGVVTVPPTIARAMVPELEHLERAGWVIEVDYDRQHPHADVTFVADPKSPAFSVLPA